jgi:hypothetical protein
VESNYLLYLLCWLKINKLYTSILLFTCVTFLSNVLQITVNNYSEQDCLGGALSIVFVLRSGVRISGGARGIFLLQNVQAGTATHSASYSIDTEVHLRGLKIITHLHPVLGLRTSEAVPLLTLFLWVITQRLVAITYRHFVTTYRSHLQFTRIPEGSSSHLFRGGNLESQIKLYPLYIALIYDDVVFSLCFRFLYRLFLSLYTKVRIYTFTLVRRQGTSNICNHFYIIQIICAILLKIMLYSDLILLPGRSGCFARTQSQRFH